MKFLTNLVLAAVVAVFATTVQAQTQTPAQTQASGKPHLVAVHVDESDPATMSLALGNIKNIEKYYKSINQPVTVEVVTLSGGLNMARADKSPVADMIKQMQRDLRDFHISACLNTINSVTEKEGHEPPLLEGVKIVPSGVVRLMELQEQGYSYLRP